MKKILLVGLLSTLLVLPISAGAVTFDLTISNVLTPDLYGHVTISQVDATTVKFLVDLDESKLNPVSNYGIDKFFFNTSISPLQPVEHWLFSGVPASDWDIQSFDSGEAGFDTFSIQYKGSGSSRFEPLEFELQYFENLSGSGTHQDPYVRTGSAKNIFVSDFDAANSDGNHVLVHVGGIDVQGQGSAFLSDGPAPVPEPGTMMLLGSGLAGLAGWGRKKFRK